MAVDSSTIALLLINVLLSTRLATPLETRPQEFTSRLEFLNESMDHPTSKNVTYTIDEVALPIPSIACHQAPDTAPNFNGWTCTNE